MSSGTSVTVTDADQVKYFRLVILLLDELPRLLRKVFLNAYKTENNADWNDNDPSLATKLVDGLNPTPDAPVLKALKTGNSASWDTTCLSYILTTSKKFPQLANKVKDAIHALRKCQNALAHGPKCAVDVAGFNAQHPKINFQTAQEVLDFVKDTCVSLNPGTSPTERKCLEELLAQPLDRGAMDQIKKDSQEKIKILLLEIEQTQANIHAEMQYLVTEFQGLKVLQSHRPSDSFQRVQGKAILRSRDWVKLGGFQEEIKGSLLQVHLE
jgi:hypothetical protein